MLNIQNLHVHAGDTALLRDISFTLESGQVLAVLGRSGSGKTTLLRTLAGHLRATDGVISFGSEEWNSPSAFVPAHRRGIGYVAQDPTLFEHLDLLGNLTFGYKEDKVRHSALRLDSLIERFALAPLLQLRPSEASTGQGQRIALVRALLCQPNLLVLDEPWSSLDDAMAHTTVQYLSSLLSECNLPAIVCSHRPTDIFGVASHGIVLNRGVCKQYDTIDRLYSTPSSLASANALGRSSAIKLWRHEAHWTSEFAPLPQSVTVSAGKEATWLLARPHMVVATEAAHKYPVISALPTGLGLLVEVVVPEEICPSGRVWAQWSDEHSIPKLHSKVDLAWHDLPESVELHD